MYANKKLTIGLASCLLMLSLTACSQETSTNNVRSNTNNSGNTGSSNTSSSNTSSSNTSSNNNTGNTTSNNFITSSNLVSTAAKPSPSTSGKKTIVFNSMGVSDELKQITKKYEASHPNIEIKFETPKSLDPSKVKGDDIAKSWEQFETNRDLQMLTGKGPDILQFAQNLLPKKYASHHLLADIGAMMDKDPTFKKKDYFTNIIDNSKDSKGALYFMPLGFGLSGFYGDADAIDKAGVKIDDNKWTWNDFLNTAKKLADSKGPYKAVLGNNPTQEVVEIVKSNPSMVMDTANKKARFNTPEFKNLLSGIKKMADAGYFGASRGYFSNQFVINDPWNFFQLGSNYYKNGRFYTQPHPEGKTGGYFFIYSALSINSSSKVKAEAWDYIKFVMSEEGKTASRTYGMPISKQGFDNQIKQLKETGVATKQHPELKVDQARLNEFIRRVNEASIQDNNDMFVNWLLVGELNAYFSGQKSLDAVVKILQDKTTTYLNE